MNINVNQTTPNYLALSLLNISSTFSISGRKFTVTPVAKVDEAIMMAVNISDKFTNNKVNTNDHKYKSSNDSQSSNLAKKNIKNSTINIDYTIPFMKKIKEITNDMSTQEKNSVTNQTHALVSLVIIRNIINKIKEKKNDALTDNKQISLVCLLTKNMLGDNSYIYDEIKKIKGSGHDEKKITSKIKKFITSTENKLLNDPVLKKQLVKQKNAAKEKNNAHNIGRHGSYRKIDSSDQKTNTSNYARGNLKETENKKHRYCDGIIKEEVMFTGEVKKENNEPIYDYVANPLTKQQKKTEKKAKEKELKQQKKELKQQEKAEKKAKKKELKQQEMELKQQEKAKEKELKQQRVRAEILRKREKRNNNARVSSSNTSGNKNNFCIPQNLLEWSSDVSEADNAAESEPIYARIKRFKRFKRFDGEIIRSSQERSNDDNGPPVPPKNKLLGDNLKPSIAPKPKPKPTIGTTNQQNNIKQPVASNSNMTNQNSRLEKIEERKINEPTTYADLIFDNQEGNQKQRQLNINNDDDKVVYAEIRTTP